MAISRSTRITILLVIDVIFFFVELISGYVVGSLALVADSFHMLNDVLSLIVALYAIKLSANSATEQYSYGWHRAEILGALVNGVFLLALSCSIVMEAIQRFVDVPEISNPKIIMIVGGCGLLSNIIGLLLFHEHSHGHSHGAHDPEPATNAEVVAEDESSFVHPAQTRAQIVETAHEITSLHSPINLTARRSRASLDKDTNGHANRADLLIDTEPNAPPAERSNGSVHAHAHDHAHAHADALEAQKANGGHGHAHGSMNMRALVLHVMGDALGNVGVIVTGLVILLAKGSWRFYFDPTISVVISIIIFSSALPLVKSTSLILLQAVPSHVSLNDVRTAICNLPNVLGVHELHVWQLSETKIVASVHVKIAREADYMDVTGEIRRVLHEHGIHSATVQPEYGTPEHDCDSEETARCLVPCPPGICTDQDVCCPPATTRPPTRPPTRPSTPPARSNVA